MRLPLLLLCAALATACTTRQQCLTFIHFNDVHDRTEPADGAFSACNATRAPCYGGLARMATVIANASADARARGCIPVVLDAGDQMTGTLWDGVYHGLDSVVWQNMVGVQAMTIGNHDFDSNTSGLINYTRAADFPILSANIDFGAIPELDALVEPHTVLTLDDGVKVGIVGVTTKDTAQTAAVDPAIKFHDEATAAQRSIDQLHAQGVNIVIVLSHTGYQQDVVMAEELNGTQLIIGGHSHTFLFSPDSSNPLPVLSVDASGKGKTDVPSGPYPTVVGGFEDATLVVQAYWGSRYVGVLDTTWCLDTGALLSWSGSPVLVNYTTVEPDADIDALIEEFGGPVRAAYNQIIGSSLTNLTRNYYGESTLGNAVTDSFIWGLESHTTLTQQHPEYDVVAVYQSGGLRGDLMAGNLSYGLIRTAMPFGNTGAVLEVNGSIIRQALEFMQHNDTKRGFLQVAGIRYGRDLSQNTTRVVNVQVLDHETNTYQPLQDNATYYLLTSNYIAAGGDAFTMFAGAKEEDPSWLSIMQDATIFQEYIASRTPIAPKIEGRVVDCQGALTATDDASLCTTAGRRLLVLTR